MAELLRYKSDVASWRKDLAKVEGGLALAAAEMLNTVGGFAHAESAKNLRKRFTLRNGYTEGSLKAFPVNYKRSNGKFREVERMKYISATWSKYLPLHESGGRQKPLAGARFIPMATTAGRPNASRPIPNRLRLGPRGTPQGSTFGPHSTNPMKLFALPSGIYYRAGKGTAAAHRAGQRKYDRLFGAMGPMPPAKPRRLVMVRTLGVRSQKVKATRWHSSAMREWGTWSKMRLAYVQAARRIIGGDTVAL